MVEPGGFSHEMAAKVNEAFAGLHPGTVGPARMSTAPAVLKAAPARPQSKCCLEIAPNAVLQTAADLRF